MRSGFFDAEVLGYDEYGNPQFDRAESAGFLASFVSGFIRSGVSPEGGRLAVKPGGGMQVQVEPGKCIIQGYFGWAEEPEVLALEPADSLLDRIDCVMARLDRVERRVTLELVTGVPGSAPVPPAPARWEEGAGDRYELCLAQVRVSAGLTEVTEAEIADLRPDPGLCGWISSPLTLPEQVPEGRLAGGEQSLVLGRTCTCEMGELASLTLDAQRPEEGVCYGYDLRFISGETPTVLTVPEGWQFAGQDCVDGVFAPAPGSEYEMVGAWHDGVLRWVVMVW